MNKMKTTSGNGDGDGKAETIHGQKVEYLPKVFEVDTSPTALAFAKAVRATRKRLYPELYQGKKKRG